MSKEQEPSVETEETTAQATPEAPVEAEELPLEQQLRDEIETLKEKEMRLVAEMRNITQRAAREKLEEKRYAEADFAKELLQIVDDLERTIQSGQSVEAATPVVEGVRIVLDHLLKVFKSRGIEPIEAAGAAFDPSFHEALMQQPSAEHPVGTVIQEVARGYRMRERVLRPAKVVVSSGQG